MFWTLVLLGILGLVAWGVTTLYHALVMRKVKDFKDIHGNVMKGTPPTFLIGDFLKDYFSPPSLEKKSFLHYGDIYYRWFFWKPTVMVVDHAAINRVLNESDVYRKNTPTFQPFFEGSELLNQSNAVRAVFSEKNMDTLGATVASLAQDLCGQLVDSQGNGVPFDVYKTSLEYCREVVGTLLYGDSFAARQIMTAQKQLSELSGFRNTFRSFFPSVAKMAPSFFGIEQAAELSAGMESSISSPAPNTTLAFLKQHHMRAEGNKEEEDDESKRLDDDDETEFERYHLQRLKDDKSDKSSNDGEDKDHMDTLKLRQSISNIISFYTSGLDTSASILTSVIYMLMRHPDVQEQLREEIIKSLDGDKITYSKMKENKMLTNVIKETLRMHPPYPILYPRISRRSDRLGGFHIPNETNIIIDVVGHNRHPSYWTRPDEFDHTRFDNPKAAKYVLAWGSGPQEKVGRSLGMLVLRCTISTLLLKYRIVCGSTDSASAVSQVKFQRTVGSLHPSPPLTARVTALDA